MSSLRIAVTGGSGNIGSKVVKALVDRGHSVINLDRRAPQESHARFVYIDLRQRAQLQPILEQVDAVCHLGEIPNNMGPFSPDELFAYNTAVASTVAQTAADLKLKRLVYTSSCQVYGCWGEFQVPPARLPVDEEHPLQPQHAYAASKVANEVYVRAVASRHNLSCAIFRLPWVPRPNQFGGWDHLVQYLEKREIHYADGAGSFGHIDDVTNAYALALEQHRPGCEVYNIASSGTFSLVPTRDLVGFFKQWPAWPKSRGEFESPLDCSKAQAHFGWKPAFNMREEYTRRTGKQP